MKKSKKRKETRSEKRERKANEKAMKKAEKAREKTHKISSDLDTSQVKTTTTPLPSGNPPIRNDATIGHEKNVKFQDSGIEQSALAQEEHVSMIDRRTGDLLLAPDDARVSTDNVYNAMRVDEVREPLAVDPEKVSIQERLDESGFDTSDFLNPNLDFETPPDPNLWGGMRIMVPVDVQALVVPPSSPIQDWANLQTEWVQKQSPPGTSPAQAQMVGQSILWAKQPSAFEMKQGTLPTTSPSSPNMKISQPSYSRPSGIHLHWAMPDALLSGSVIPEEDEPEYLNLDDNICVDCGNSWTNSGSTFINCPDCLSTNPPISAEDAARSDMEVPQETEESQQQNLNDLFTFPQLPNRWLVVRTWPNSADTTLPWNSKAWVVESESLSVTPLDQWSPTLSAGPVDEMTAIGPNSGDFSWTVTYDNSEGRFTFHDIPDSNVVGPLNYLVTGWYDRKEEDPLWCSSTQAQGSWWRQLADLGWSVDKQHLKTTVNDEMTAAGITWQSLALNKGGGGIGLG